MKLNKIWKLFKRYPLSMIHSVLAIVVLLMGLVYKLTLKEFAVIMVVLFLILTPLFLLELFTDKCVRWIWEK